MLTGGMSDVRPACHILLQLWPVRRTDVGSRHIAAKVYLGQGGAWLASADVAHKMSSHHGAALITARVMGRERCRAGWAQRIVDR